MRNKRSVRYRKPPLTEALCEFRFQETGIPLNVQPPKKRVLASMKVRLSSEDFKRGVPRPVMSVRSESQDSGRADHD